MNAELREVLSDFDAMAALVTRRKVTYSYAPDELASAAADFIDKHTETIRSALLAAAQDGEDVRVPRAALDWLVGGDTGLSSKFVWVHMAGGNPKERGWGVNYPLDPADLGRCLRLLQRVPEWQPRIHEMAQYSPEWNALCASWANLAAEMEREVGIGWEKGRSAPETYKSMRTILDAARSADAEPQE
jgi:hypothetical protein